MRVKTFLTAALLATSLPALANSYTEAEVRKVDVKAKQVTLKHGAIDNIGMPPMTMSFAVRDPAMLKGIKEGDKVQFKADKVGEVFTVVELKKKG